MNIIKYNMPWIESPFFEQELKRTDYDEDTLKIINDFAKNGYVIIDLNISDNDIDKLISELDPTFDQNLKNPAMSVTENSRILDAWKFSDQVKQLAVNKKVLSILELLYRRKPFAFQTLNFKTGTEQRTHSDMIHFSSLPERFMCGVWVGLEDIHDNNGPLHYYPGSHKLPFYDMFDIGIVGSGSKGYDDYVAYYEDFIENVIRANGLQKEKLNIKKGQALIWAANLLHGGEPILDKNSTRYSQVTHYYFEDCVYYTPLYTDMVLKKVHLRKMLDINTGSIMYNKYLGHKVDHGFMDKVKIYFNKNR